MNRIAIAGLLTVTLCAPAAEKKILDHDCFDAWKSVANHAFSNNGTWGAYSVNPQEGDGTLTFYSVKGGRSVGIPRGYNPSFTADGKWGMALIKPLFTATRDARRKGKKDNELPKDSLAIVNLETLGVEK
ncbi:MAG: hypothetical protein K2J70_07430, partial [Muribaculaceae bacterium]|nr:hypothetical protein [Muribaculaceae bacterium]